jgi:hypothetical protein
LYVNTNTVLVTVDQTTEEAFIQNDANFGGVNNAANGVIFGYGINGSDPIELHQGLDTSEVNSQFTIDQDLKETQYVVEIDNRLGTIIAPTSTQQTVEEAAKSFVDDDNIAQYYFSLVTDDKYVQDSNYIRTLSSVGNTIKGPKGTALVFSIRSSLESQTSTYLFTTFGQSTTIAGIPCYVIKSTITVTGVTTGFSVSIPVTFVKKQ